MSESSHRKLRASIKPFFEISEANEAAL